MVTSNSSTDILTALETRISEHLEHLSSLTLGELLSPPAPLRALFTSRWSYPFPRSYYVACAAIFVVHRLWKMWAWLAARRQSRRVCTFELGMPEQADPKWVGRVISAPDLFAHQRDSSLLPTTDTSIDGEKSAGGYLTCYDPSTAYHLTTLPLLSADQVSAQIGAAHAAQKTWARTSFAQRQSVMRSLRAWVVRDMEQIVAVACRDTGKTRVDAVFGEILTTLSKLEWLINYGEQTLAPEKRPTNLLLSHKRSEVHYEPIGVTLALVSWNYSFHNLISPLLASLFAGNACVVKCSEQVAWSSAWFMRGIQECLRACGHDEGLVQLVVCLPEVAGGLARDPRVGHVTFIGSEVVGKKVALAAAENMVPTCIELGGKDPAFLLPSADLKYFGSTFLRGAFQSAGQNCIGIELFLVPTSLHAAFLEQLLPRVAALRIGTDVGSLISHAPIARLEGLIARAVDAGARVLAGGKRYVHPLHPEGAYFEPTVLVDVTLDMEIAQEELFAPVMTVIRYEDGDGDVARVVDRLGRGRFGLGASVWGRDREECRRVAKGLGCGMVAVNDFGVFYLNQAMPFGGVKASGHGRFGGPEGLRALCNVKAVTEDRWFGWIQTPIPRAVDFPLPKDSTSWAFLQGLVGMAYGQSVWGRVRGLARLAMNASG